MFLYKVDSKKEKLENFKVAISSTVKSLSNSPKIEVSFGNQISKTDQKLIKLPDLNSLNNKINYGEIRAIADSKSLMVRFSDEKIFKYYEPEGNISKRLYKITEKIRCEKIGSNYFKELCNFNSISVYDGADFKANDIPKVGNTALIFLSQSGETKDLHRCINIGKELDLFLIGVINVVDSMIAREVDCGVYLNAGREVGVASTKCFTSQVIVLSLISIWFSQIHNHNVNQRKEAII